MKLSDFGNALFPLDTQEYRNYYEESSYIFNLSTVMNLKLLALFKVTVASDVCTSGDVRAII
jgi:hypothetical protein